MPNIYETFENENIEYSYPYSFADQNIFYIIPYNQSSITWHYGDTITINFNLSEGGEPVSLVNKQVRVTFYNFRFEKFYEKLYVPNDQEVTTISFSIDRELSKEFKRGEYYCELDLEDQLDTGEITTITPRENLRMRVI